MNRINSSLFCIALAALMLSGCAPQSFTMNIEMRYPSKSGLQLAGKTMSVVYLDNGTKADSSFNVSASSGFAKRMESDYFNGQEAINIYKLPKLSGNYASKDSLVNLIMDTGDDVVFLFDSPLLGDVTVSSNSPVSSGVISPDSAYLAKTVLPFTINMYVYDSMNKNDKVLSFNGSNEIHPLVYNNGKESNEKIAGKVWDSVGPVAETVGQKAAGTFISQWQAEQYTIIYYDNLEDAWQTASEDAYNYRWQEAIDTWMTLLKTRNMEKRSCAEYDIALGCYMLGNYSLSLKWLDQSDKDYPVSLSKGLRKRITTRQSW